MKFFIAAGATVKAVASLLFTALFLSLCIPVHAQQYPVRPIRLGIPWPPGGITDVISRTIAAALSESLGQQVVPDNRPGAAGTLGVSIGAHAQPDGYTLIMTDVPSHAISATLYKKLNFDSVKDVEPIALPSRSPLVLVVNPKLGVKTIAQLIEQAKARPGQVAFASSGSGSITHLTAERFIAETGVKLLHVPYKGGGPAAAALVAGESGMYFSCISAAIPHIKSGRLTLLGITTAERSSLFPESPTVAEALPGFVMGCNTGLFGTGGTPARILDRIHADVMKAVEQPKVKSVLTSNAAEASTFTREQFKAYVLDEINAWGKIVRAAGLTVD